MQPVPMHLKLALCAWRQQGWRSKGQGVQAKESRYDEFFSNLDEGRHVARSVSDVLPVAGSRYLAGDRWNVRASADKTRHGDAKLTHITAYAMLPALQGARGNHVHRMEEEENAGHAHGGSISLDNGLTNRHLPSGCVGGGRGEEGRRRMG
ncbi:hypothetical protein GUITHDRAFT_145689 [Guillardia theta CCMP2712]|uniref:Uncharacterized protein n=1 Tax=Guillardia theta (strain CCMP2712) TaxID=905079 RepID=L1IJV7_GUITC|nr:hypothetical protein GUITHDRAFT_145689 [Guillardia theta CCMP2712]EKX36521.1 hypothetical protein GUITHDRAFT_145689 [Guillardia theta CCMP2712]|eukprot:XP_005823501.1 hypothetical protein GUITHDRAFT_145689 [Guillardia theta CCMP2712]